MEPTDVSPEVQTGQVEGDSSPQTPEQPGQATGLNVSTQDAGQAPSPPQPTEPTFFDPATVPPELLPAYKQMQGAFTKKAQEIARERDKVNAFNAFLSNPYAPEMAQFLAQYGYVPANHQQQNPQPTQSGEYQPESWEALLQEAEARAERRVLERISPYLNQVQQQGAKAVESQLDKIDSNWREYENEMAALVREHPSLVKHPDKLYRLAVPPEILEAKAIQQALSKFQKQGQHAAVETRAGTPRSQPAKRKITSWEEAVAAASEQVRKGEV